MKKHQDMSNREATTLLTLYASVIASIDWQRDVRRRETICRDALKIAVLAVAVFDEYASKEQS